MKKSSDEVYALLRLSFLAQLDNTTQRCNKQYDKINNREHNIMLQEDANSQLIRLSSDMNTALETIQHRLKTIEDSSANPAERCQKLYEYAEQIDRASYASYGFMLIFQGKLRKRWLPEAKAQLTL